MTYFVALNGATQARQDLSAEQQKVIAVPEVPLPDMSLCCFHPVVMLIVRYDQFSWMTTTSFWPETEGILVRKSPSKLHSKKKHTAVKATRKLRESFEKASQKAEEHVMAESTRSICQRD